MNGLIKQSGKRGRNIVTPVSMDMLSRKILPTPVDPKMQALQSDIHNLMSENDRLKAVIEQLKEDKKVEIKEAYELGQTNTTQTYARDEEAQLATLKTGLQSALLSLKEKLDDNESLALLLAQQALKPVFSPHADYKDQVGRMISLQTQKLHKDLVLSVDVSSKDFSDTDKFSSLGKELGLDMDRLQVSEDLKAGDCRIELKIGQINLSLEDHWNGIKALFDELKLGT